MLSAIWQQIKDFAFITWLKTKSEDSLAYMLVRSNVMRALIYKVRFVVSVVQVVKEMKMKMKMPEMKGNLRPETY